MMVESCTSCQEKLPSNQKEPHLPHTLHGNKKNGADIYEFQGRSLFLIVDHYSKYPEVLRLSDRTSGTVRAKFRAVFARRGIAAELMADHLHLSSAETAQFAKEWGF
jgi:hypothetical protein